MSSLELDVFNACSAKIFKAIQQEADTLIWSLFSEKLISSDVRKRACESGKAACATLLLNSVGNAIGNSPANFATFLSILQQEAVFEYIVKDLQEALRLAVEKRERNRLSLPSVAKSIPVPSTLPLQHQRSGETLVMEVQRPPVIPNDSEVVGAVRNTSGISMQQQMDMLHSKMSNLEMGSNHRSAFHSATTRDVEQQDSPHPVVQETLNPFQKSVTGSTTSPGFTLIAATPLIETGSALHFGKTSAMTPSRSKSEESTESSCDEEARELIEILDGNIGKLDHLKKRLQEKKQKYKLKKRLYCSQLEGKEKELMRLEELVDSERNHNSTNKETIDFLIKQLLSEKERARVAENERRQLQQNMQNPNIVYELEHWKRAYEKAISEVEIRNAEIVRLQQQIDYLLQQEPLTPVDSSAPS